MAGEDARPFTRAPSPTCESSPHKKRTLHILFAIRSSSLRKPLIS